MSALGVVLAGGRGRRIGGDKAAVALDGVALVQYPLAALRAVLGPPVVVTKAQTVLPPLPADVEVWTEPDTPHHPLTGIVHALERAGGRDVLCCAVDLPLLDAPILRALLNADAAAQVCVLPRAGGRLHPLCALWRPGALTALRAAGPEPRMRDVVATLDAFVVELADPGALLNVNAPEDLLLASARLSRR